MCALSEHPSPSYLDGAMTSHTNGVWLETLTREKRAKEKWQAKYLSREEQTLAREEEQAEVAALKETMSSTQRRLSEKDASALRLEALASEVDDEPLQEAARPVSSYELCRRKVAEDVAMRRTLSHRFSGDLTTPSLLRDISPGMWASINSGALSHGVMCFVTILMNHLHACSPPVVHVGYNFTSSQFTSSSHSAHSFNKVSAHFALRQAA